MAAPHPFTYLEGSHSTTKLYPHYSIVITANTTAMHTIVSENTTTRTHFSHGRMTHMTDVDTTELKKKVAEDLQRGSAERIRAAFEEAKQEIEKLKNNNHERES